MGWGKVNTVTENVMNFISVYEVSHIWKNKQLLSRSPSGSHMKQPYSKYSSCIHTHTHTHYSPVPSMPVKHQSDMNRPSSKQHSSLFTSWWVALAVLTRETRAPFDRGRPGSLSTTCSELAGSLKTTQSFLCYFGRARFDADGWVEQRKGEGDSVKIGNGSRMS